MTESEEVFEKEINQLDKIDKTVDKTITDMGTIWKLCGDKLAKDGICFICKNKFKKDEEFSIVKVPEKKIDIGLFALAAVCKECNKK